VLYCNDDTHLLEGKQYDTDPGSGVFRGGHGAMAPLWPDHENFLQATLYEKVRFCRFPANLLKNG